MSSTTTTRTCAALGVCQARAVPCAGCSFAPATPPPAIATYRAGPSPMRQALRMRRLHRMRGGFL